MELNMALLVPVSSESGRAHWMELSGKQKLVRPICGKGPFNTAYAKMLDHAKFCGKCQEQLTILERAE